MPGYNINLEETKVGTPLLCTLCKKLLRQPVQTLCGHRCCASCVKEWQGVTNSFKCPVDGELVNEIYPDRFVEREVLNLKVNCLNQKAGCKWIGIVRDFEAHVESCPFVFINCSNAACQVSLARGDLDKHVKDECQYRRIKCPLCKRPSVANELKNHQDKDCPNFKVKCSQCDKEINRAQLPWHQESECDEAIIKCPFSKVGCAATRPMKKQERRKHMDNALSNHVTYLLTFLMEIHTKTETLLRETGNRSATSAQTEELNAAFETFKSQYKLIAGRVEKLEQLSLTKGASASCSNEPEYSKSTVTATASAQIVSRDHTREISNMESKLLAYEAVEEELKKKISDQERAMDALKDWNRRLEGKINSLEHELALKGITMVEQHEKLDTLEQSSFNGILIWPIESFMKKRHDAIIGKTASLYSPVFYTGRHGYKLRVRIYLNGDGLGKGTHISLFFVVCKSNWDALLPWPFRQKVTMLILDQDNVEHVVDSFRPDPLSSSFQKPKNEMNVASGCPLFMPLSHLDTRTYVRDDTMFVKVTVDTSGLDNA